MTRPPTPSVQPLHQLAARIGEELDTMGQLSLSVQHAMSRCTGTMGRDPQVMNALQGIDRISQSLAELARLMQYVSKTTPQGISVPSAALQENLALRDMTKRLLAKAPPEPQDDDTVLAGDVTWF
jgi:division protein CdvB (Snf7/Vps24/ESCRT-III family)